jgi:hypothetical protein
MIKKKTIGLVVTDLAITALLIEEYFGKRSVFHLRKAALPAGCLHPVSGAIADTLAFRKVASQLLDNESRWSLVETSVYLVLPQRLFHHFCRELPEECSNFRRDGIGGGDLLEASGEESRSVTGPMIVDIIWPVSESNCRQSSKISAMGIATRQDYLLEYLEILGGANRFIQMVLSPEIATYRLWSISVPEIRSLRVLIISVRDTQACCELWDRGMLVYQSDNIKGISNRLLSVLQGPLDRILYSGELREFDSLKSEMKKNYGTELVCSVRNYEVLLSDKLNEQSTGCPQEVLGTVAHKIDELRLKRDLCWS